MKKLISNNRGASLLMVLILGGVVASTGYLALNTYKDNMNAAKKDSLTQRSGYYKNLIENKLVSGSCETYFPQNAWKQSLSVGAEAIQNAGVAELAIRQNLGLDGEEVKLLGSEVLEPDNTGKGNLVEVVLGLYQTQGPNSSSRSQKIRLFVKNRICVTALGSDDNLGKYCDSIGGYVPAGGEGCVFNTEETQEVSDGEYEKVSVTRNMDETLCRLKLETGNLQNLKNVGAGHSPPNCKIGGQDVLYGCHLESGAHIENEASYTGTKETKKNKVEGHVNNLRAEAINSQGRRVASKLQRLTTYVENINAGVGGNLTFLEQMVVEFHSSIYGALAVQGASMLLGGTLFGSLLGVVPAIAPFAAALAIINVICTGSKRRIKTSYTCNKGGLEITAMKLQKRKFKCKWLKCGCHWRNEKDLPGVSFNSTLQSILDNNPGTLLGTSDFDDPYPDPETQAQQEQMIADMIAAINNSTTIQELYAPYFEDDGGEDEEENMMAGIPEIESAFLVRELELWTDFIATVNAIDATAADAQDILDGLIEPLNEHFDIIESNNVRLDVNQAISNKQNEINS